MRIGIIGGTFNPPHKGHVLAGEKAQEMLKLDKVLFIPTNTSPHKEMYHGMPTPNQRAEMTRLATVHLPFAEVSTTEIDRGGVSYTVDTLREITKIYENAEIFFVMGTDMFASLESWREFRSIMKMCSIVVIPRNLDHLDEIFEAKEHYEKEYDAKVYVFDKMALDISSTMIREIKNVHDGRELVSENVLNYILENKLYF